MPVKHSTTLRRELGRVTAEQDRKDLDEWYRGVLYGAHQALAWALGQGAAPPHHITPPTGAK